MSTSGELLQTLRASALIAAEDWQALPEATRAELAACADESFLLTGLTRHGLLTSYQAERIAKGKRHELSIGGYRVLERLGAGGMGIVFKAEHSCLRRLAAIKVLFPELRGDARLVQRFVQEIRIASQLQHPHIVAVLDAGETPSLEPSAPSLPFYVMEYIAGDDLEKRVTEQGPMPPARACEIATQIASALEEAERHRLVHRDLKPSNVLLSADHQAKLLDFGLALRTGHRMTRPGAMLGTVDYMAPEQARDASRVDIRADIFSLGGIRFWCLSGRDPYASDADTVQIMFKRMTQAPPSVRGFCPEIAPELDAVIAKMMAPRAEDRFANPRAVRTALLPFLGSDARETVVLESRPARERPCLSRAGEASVLPRPPSILIVDDDDQVAQFARHLLELEGYACRVAEDGDYALNIMRTLPVDLVLVDMNMPGMGGLALLRNLRDNPPSPHLKIILFSGETPADVMAEALSAGADDFLTKPCSAIQLRARVKAALALKNVEERSDLLTNQLLTLNTELERDLDVRNRDLVHSRNALVLALAKLVGNRGDDTELHFLRLQRYTRRLAEEAAGEPAFVGQILPEFVQMLEYCIPLHDIGKVTLPEHILMKPGSLQAEERLIMESHALVGASAFQEVSQRYSGAMAFVKTAIDLIRHHHEAYDGTGYPDRLAGGAIPLSARLFAFGDVYDALRSKRVYRPALSHDAACRIITQTSASRFDPNLLPAFQRCAGDFERIFRELPD